MPSESKDANQANDCRETQVSLHHTRSHHTSKEARVSKVRC
jgi:hypothetical protein